MGDHRDRARPLGLGAWLLTGREITFAGPKLGARGDPTSSVWAMGGYGVSFAVASLSCTVGPFLAVTTTAFRDGSVLGVIGVFVAYALGMGAVVGALTLAAAVAWQSEISRAVADLNATQIAAVMVGLALAVWGTGRFARGRAAGRAVPTPPLQAQRRDRRPRPADRTGDAESPPPRGDPRPERAEMYAWIWRHLPGPAPIRVLLGLGLLAGTVYLPFASAFPWIDPRLPFNQIAPEGAEARS